MRPKQIVFLFMVGTVLFVTTFLLGVSVGRDFGARGDQRIGMGQEQSAKPIRDAENAPQESAGVGSSSPSAAEGDLSYFRRLLGDAAWQEPSFPVAVAKD